MADSVSLSRAVLLLLPLLLSLASFPPLAQAQSEDCSGTPQSVALTMQLLGSDRAQANVLFCTLTIQNLCPRHAVSYLFLSTFSHQYLLEPRLIRAFRTDSFTGFSEPLWKVIPDPTNASDTAAVPPGGSVTLRFTGSLMGCNPPDVVQLAYA